MVRMRPALAALAGQIRPEWLPEPAASTGEAAPAVVAVDPQLVFEAALAHHSAKRLDAAEAAAKEAIAHSPSHAGGHHLLGIVAIQRGDHQNALTLLNRSIGLDPNVEQVHNNLGIAL